METRIVLTTAPTQHADSLAKELLQKKLIACVNIISGVRSLYHWNGALCDEQEVLLVMKTGEERLSELEVALHLLHPYKVPEFIVIRTEHVSRGYAEWLKHSVAPGPTG